MKIRNPQSLLDCPSILCKSSLTRVEWISGWRSWLASRIQSCVWCSAFTRYMRWCVFWYVGNPRIEPLWIRWWRRRRWIYKKRFPIFHACPKCLAAYRCGSAFLCNCLAFRQDLAKGGSNAGWLATWECPLRTDSASVKSLESFVQLTSFCNSWILVVNSRIVSWFSIKLLLENSSNVDPWNRFNSSISLRLFIWVSKIPILFLWNYKNKS